MNNNLYFDIFGWFCIFFAGLGLIFPYSVIAPLNLIFISLGLTYLSFFVWREIRLQTDPSEIKDIRKNWLLETKNIELEERKFEHRNNSNIYFLTNGDGITFNAPKLSTKIPWSEIIQIRSLRVLGQDLNTIYTLKSKIHFDQTYKDHLELAEIIRKQL